jgi:hypothetical protein
VDNETLRPLAMSLRHRAYAMCGRHNKPHIQFVPREACAQFNGHDIHGYVMFRLDKVPIVARTIPAMIQLARIGEICEWVQEKKRYGYV